jgi:predicted histidine transporter YuiF (NhaC family)
MIAPFAGYAVAGGVGSLFGTLFMIAGLMVWMALELTAPTQEEAQIEVAGLLTE